MLIGGFILGPDGGAKRIAVRALGPSLGQVGVPGALADPSLQLIDATGQVFASNDDWAQGNQAQEITALGLAPNDPRESALLATLPSGGYTAIVQGAIGTSNIALVEIFDLEAEQTPQLLNISTRGGIGTGDAVMIAGTIIGGQASQTLVIRGLGPSLAGGLSGTALLDPTLLLVDSQGTAVFANDNWQDSQANEIAATGLGAANSLESAMLVTLAPGAYTALLTDRDGRSGIGLLEIYNVTHLLAQ